MTFRMTAQEKSTTHSIPDTLGASTEASYELLLADFQLSEFDIRRSTAGNTHTREGAALPTLSDSELPDRWVHPPARIQLPRPPERTADIGTGESGLSSTRHLPGRGLQVLADLRDSSGLPGFRSANLYPVITEPRFQELLPLL